MCRKTIVCARLRTCQKQAAPLPEALKSRRVVPQHCTAIKGHHMGNCTSSSPTEPLKLVVVGDGYCGKTCLLFTFRDNSFPHSLYSPTVFNNYPAKISVKGRDQCIVLWDTAGSEDYKRIRPLSYPHTNVVLLCFSVDMPDSLSNVIDVWRPEILRFMPNVPIMLVANKKDLQGKDRLVAREEGVRVAREIGAVGYFECSAKLNDGVQEIFRDATLQAIKHANKYGTG